MTYVASDRNIPKVIGKEEKSQNMRLVVRLGNPFGNIFNFLCKRHVSTKIKYIKAKESHYAMS